MFVIAWWTLIIRYIFAYAKETASATLVYLCVCVKICVGVCVLNFGFLKSKTFPAMLITRLPANLCWVNVSIWVSVKNCKWRTHLLEFICMVQTLFCCFWFNCGNCFGSLGVFFTNYYSHTIWKLSHLKLYLWILRACLCKFSGALGYLRVFFCCSSVTFWAISGCTIKSKFTWHNHSSFLNFKYHIFNISLSIEEFSVL